MVQYVILGYFFLGVVTIILVAYDPFSQTFDFGLSDGWEFWWWQRYVLWFFVIIGCPFFLPKELIKKGKDRKYVKEWRTKGSFTRKL